MELLSKQILVNRLLDVVFILMTIFLLMPTFVRLDVIGLGLWEIMSYNTEKDLSLANSFLPIVKEVTTAAVGQISVSVRIQERTKAVFFEEVLVLTSGKNCTSLLLFLT